MCYDIDESESICKKCIQSDKANHDGEACLLGLCKPGSFVLVCAEFKDSQGTPMVKMVKELS